METLNDVMDFAKYYKGKDEPPMFYHEHFDINEHLSLLVIIKWQIISVDSKHCYSCLNLANILKARIIASVGQEKYAERVMLNLIWGDKDSYEMAFGNIEKETIISVSSQAIGSNEIFETGIKP